MKRKIRYLIAGILLIGVILVISSIALKYNITPNETYKIDKENLIEDGGFEKFNRAVIDCCNDFIGNAIIFGHTSHEAYNGEYSLNLTSSNHCACSFFPVQNFTNENKYLLNFYYKGDNPRFCNWVGGEDKCNSLKYLPNSEDWISYKEIIVTNGVAKSSSIYLYADSDGSRTVINLYDDLQVHKLIPMENPSEYEYNSEEEYIFKTKADNNVKGDMISEVDAKTGEAYFIVKGKPSVTIKFPWSEVVIVVIMMLIVVRLLFKKQVLETEEEIKKEVDNIIKSVEQ